ncbi:hypothetical protein ACFX2I_028682 [Malus domestica]
MKSRKNTKVDDEVSARIKFSTWVFWVEAGGLRLRELPLRDGKNEEVKDLERESELKWESELENEREREREWEDEPDAEPDGERRARVSFAMADRDKNGRESLPPPSPMPEPPPTSGSIIFLLNKKQSILQIWKNGV